MEVRVGPAVLTIHSDDRFLVSEPDATLHPDRAQGFVCSDTRLVSQYRLTLCGQAPVLLNSAVTAPFAVRYELINARMLTPAGAVAEGLVHCRLDRALGGGLHEDYDLTNYAPEPVEFDLEIEIRGDYADLFDIKEHQLVRRGRLETTWRDRTLTTAYRHDNFSRGLRIEVVRNDSPPTYANGVITFRVSLDPKQSWHTCLMWVPLENAAPSGQPIESCHTLAISPPDDDAERLWRTRITSFEVGDPHVQAVLDQAVEDLWAMRIHRHDHDAATGTDTADAWVPAAGVPWFVTLFGRDSLVVSLQTLALTPGFAIGATNALAALQGDRDDDRHDEQPGKIEHEIRHGELAHFHLVPQTPYYGSHDATTLFVWTCAELWKWTGDRALLERLRSHVDRALAWIDGAGDRDGDGLQEYATRAGDWGAYNQGWKDSGTAIVNADGSNADLPIATCELQGYVIAAKRAWASVVEEAYHEHEAARRLRDEAERLAGALEQRFWWEAEGTYYLGLDGHKRPIESVASNAGQLLWCEAIDSGRAARVVERLLADDMWTGWGIRTLSSRHTAYNPFSYQRGAVWPHDNAIIVDGMLRYGHTEPAWQTSHALFDAALLFKHRRLPEVFAGLDRQPHAFPAQYLGANVPQAWASGAIIHLLTALAGPQPSGGATQLALRPRIPDWLRHLRIRNLRVGDHRLDLDADTHHCEPTNHTDLSITIQ